MTRYSNNAVANLLADTVTGSEGTRKVRAELSGGEINVDNNSIDTSGYIGKASGTNGDFVVAYASASTITLSGLPNSISSVTADDIVSIVEIGTSGAVLYTYTRDDVTITASGTDPTTLTLSGTSFTNFVATSTFIVYTNIARDTDSNVEIPPYTHSSARKDFTATFYSTTTITLAGVSETLTNENLVFVRVTDTAGTTSVTYVNGQNGVVMSVSGNVVTITGAGTPFASGDTYDLGVNITKKAYDSSLDVNKTIAQNPLWSRYTDFETLVSAQDLTAAYADFGSEINMQGYTHLRVGIVADVNNSDNVTLKLLGLDELGGSDEYEIEGGTTQALWTTGASDSKFSYTFDVKGSSFVQLQAIAGTVGATPGDLTVVISKVWKGGN